MGLKFRARISLGDREMEAAASVPGFAVLGAFLIGSGAAAIVYALVLLPLWESIKWYDALHKMHTKMISELAQRLQIRGDEAERRFKKLAEQSKELPKLVKEAKKFERVKREVFDPMQNPYQQAREIEKGYLIEKLAFAALRSDIRLWVSSSLELCPDKARGLVRPALVKLESELYDMAREADADRLPDLAVRRFERSVRERLGWEVADDEEVGEWVKLAGEKLRAAMSNWQCVVLGVKGDT